MTNYTVNSLTIEEFIEKFYQMEDGEVLTVAFKENDGNRQSPTMCESRFLTEADCDVRKKDLGNGKTLVVFSIPIDHHNGDGEIIGEVCCTIDSDISIEDVKGFLKTKGKKKGSMPEEIKNFTTIVNGYAGKEKVDIEYTWYEQYIEYNCDYQYYLDTSINKIEKGSNNSVKLALQSNETNNEVVDDESIIKAIKKALPLKNYKDFFQIKSDVEISEDDYELIIEESLMDIGNYNDIYSDKEEFEILIDTCSDSDEEYTINEDEFENGVKKLENSGIKELMRK